MTLLFVSTTRYRKVKVIQHRRLPPNKIGAVDTTRLHKVFFLFIPSIFRCERNKNHSIFNFFEQARQQNL